MSDSTTTDKKGVTNKKDEKSDKNKKKEEELSEEDLKKRSDLELLVERVQDADNNIVMTALNALRKEIRESTSSMTSVPKPLKFLRPHFTVLEQTYEKMPSGEAKSVLSDILSVLAMTAPKENSKDCLKYKLSGTKESVGLWGHEYVRHLTSEIAKEYNERREADKPVDDLMVLVTEIVPYDVAHNATAEACDLLMEVEALDKILDNVSESNYVRICQYLQQCSNYVSEPEDQEILNVVRKIYQKVGNYPDEMRIALKLGDKTLVKQIFTRCEQITVKRQLAFMLARQQYFDVLEGGDDTMETDNEDEAEVIKQILYNTKLFTYFKEMAKDFKITEAKTPEDIYKSHLENVRSGITTKVDSARQNLASTFVNGFVNCAFGEDKLILVPENNWLYKNREHGMLSAAASIGLISMWDVEVGVQRVDKLFYASEEFVKAGACLAVGIVNSGVRDEFGSALALLRDHLENGSQTVKLTSALGLGIAYAGSANEEIKELLVPRLEAGTDSIEILAHYALALGLVFCASADEGITEVLINLLIEKGEAKALESTYARYLFLGLGLLYLGKQELAEVPIEALTLLPQAKYAQLTINTLAYAGTGNVLKIQKLLAECGEHYDTEVDFQGVAVLGISLISMAEDIGIDMVLRSFDHLLQYGDLSIRRAVPLAIGLLSICNPEISVMDTLSKLSHDHDADVSMGAVFALGLIGAGTNNSRIAQMLRGLAAYHYKEPNQLFIVRLAQGLLHMGKGTITLKPFHSEKLLLNPVALAGITVVLHTCLDFKNLILSKAHYMLYLLCMAMYPRMLMTFDEKLEPLTVSVRVGQAVDVIGQAGKPKTITGFQTHTTPVLLAHGERAELATDEYIPYSSVLEGFVILRKNPNHKIKK
eukprot:TRINITY_DN11694_c0_g1_i1.p1 TRINITY_DN11694_c0_g1~~TRINITY_DN11694_c0_g1_i1.p1  ORF type:complete len:880 (+),score=144.07 TRINITY_DN11694_c0_g1_i1:41-2680(+)